MTMTAFLLASLVSIQDDQTAPMLISKVMSHYRSELIVAGEIKGTFVVAGKSVQTVTRIQFNRPNKFYLHQNVPGKPPMLAVSDGVHYVYTHPSNFGLVRSEGKKAWWVEQLRMLDGSLMGIEEMYAPICTMLPDRSWPLDLVIGRIYDLSIFRDSIGELVYHGEREVNGHRVMAVAGKLALRPGEPRGLDFAMFATKDGKLVRFAINSKQVLPNRTSVDSSLIWDVDIQTGEGTPINKSLYTLPKGWDKSL
ncbi:hypothetical protein QPK87_18420 [Kamptonema cortianum]|nr:hypothetical protein [Geitlerinema splendidum]MDK3158532.1 hypothetical protein [Kamptonema cortianum]